MIARFLRLRWHPGPVHEDYLRDVLRRYADAVVPEEAGQPGKAPEACR